MLGKKLTKQNTLPWVPSFLLPEEGEHRRLLCAYSKQIGYTDKLFLKQIKNTAVKCDPK